MGISTSLGTVQADFIGAEGMLNYFGGKGQQC